MLTSKLYCSLERHLPSFTARGSGWGRSGAALLSLIPDLDSSRPSLSRRKPRTDACVLLRGPSSKAARAETLLLLNRGKAWSIRKHWQKPHRLVRQSMSGRLCIHMGVCMWIQGLAGFITASQDCLRNDLIKSL